MDPPHDRPTAGWTRRAPGRARATLGLAGGTALCAEGLLMRGPVVGAAAAATTAIIVLATLRHERVVRFSDDHGVLANLAIVPPAFVVVACAFRDAPLPLAGLVALALGLVLALAWVLVTSARAAAAPAPPPRPAQVVERPAPAATPAPARLWASAAWDDPGAPR